MVLMVLMVLPFTNGINGQVLKSDLAFANVLTSLNIRILLLVNSCSEMIDET